MAKFDLASGHTSTAVTHRTVEEIWFIISGRSEMWRQNEEQEEVISLKSGVSI